MPQQAPEKMARFSQICLQPDLSPAKARMEKAREKRAQNAGSQVATRLLKTEWRC
jgi:hypothetical protein